MIYRSHTSKLACIAFALAALSTSGTGRAREEAPSRIVTLYDLDLTRAAHVERLDERLRRAVRRVCDVGSMQSAALARAKAECSQEAWAGIEPQRSFAIARANREPGQGELAARTGGAGIRVVSSN